MSAQPAHRSRAAWFWGLPVLLAALLIARFSQLHFAESALSVPAADVELNRGQGLVQEEHHHHDCGCLDMENVELVIAEELPASEASATVTQCKSLWYTNGAIDSEDRPHHLRAASSISWTRLSQLVVVQDDVNFLAVVDFEHSTHGDDGLLMQPLDEVMDLKSIWSLSIPKIGGYRQFDSSRKNKHMKLDLEAAVYLSEFQEEFRQLLKKSKGVSEPSDESIIDKDVLERIESIQIEAYSKSTSKKLKRESSNKSNYPSMSEKSLNNLKEFLTGELFLALGSGSTDSRDHIIVWEGFSSRRHFGDRFDPPELKVIRASTFYQALRDAKAFSGSELNIEGAALVSNSIHGAIVPAIRLFQRGNGAIVNGVHPISATCDIEVSELLAYLQNPETARVPAIHNVRRFNLGFLEGIDLTFTDATTAPLPLHADLGDSWVFYLAGAENSEDTVVDGEVAGSVVGVISCPHKEFVDGKHPAPGEHVEKCTAKHVPLRLPDGSLFKGKAEGIVLQRGVSGYLDTSSALIVLDPDDINMPCQLCSVELRGLHFFDESTSQNDN